MGRSARLFVISGPSGVGKGTLVTRVCEKRPELHLAVSATTRKPRTGERDGISYHFLSDEEFMRIVDEGGFLEYAGVHGHRYGTLRSEVEGKLAQGSSVILEIDVQGGFQVRERFEDAVLIFVEPPSLEELERRLRLRGTEDEDSIQLRLANAAGEMALAKRYDARLINDDLDTASERLAALLAHYENEGGC